MFDNLKRRLPIDADECELRLADGAVPSVEGDEPWLTVPFFLIGYHAHGSVMRIFNVLEQTLVIAPVGARTELVDVFLTGWLATVFEILAGAKAGILAGVRPGDLSAPELFYRVEAAPAAAAAAFRGSAELGPLLRAADRMSLLGPFAAGCGELVVSRNQADRDSHYGEYADTEDARLDELGLRLRRAMLAAQHPVVSFFGNLRYGQLLLELSQPPSAANAVRFRERSQRHRRNAADAFRAVDDLGPKTDLIANIASRGREMLAQVESLDE
jgi:hypothetical protein